MKQFEEYITLSEFIQGVRDEVNDKFYTDVPDKAIILILKRYEELKTELGQK